MPNKNHFFSLCKSKLEPSRKEYKLTYSEIKTLSELYDDLHTLDIDWHFKPVTYSGAPNTITVTPSSKEKKPLFGLVRKGRAEVNDRLYWFYPSDDVIIKRALRKHKKFKGIKEPIAEKDSFLPMIESVLKEQEIRQLYSLEHNEDLKQNQTLIYARGHQQRVFRNELIKEFSNKCLVTKFDDECLLEAAHIIPHAYCAYKQTKDMYSKYNGLLLRSDIHKLFDRGYISFTHQNGRLLTMVDKRIHHFEEYQMLNGTEVNLPQEKTELWVEKIMERQMLK